MNSLRPLFPPSISPPLTVLPLSGLILTFWINIFPSLIHHTKYLSQKNNGNFGIYLLYSFTFPFSSIDNFSNCISNVSLWLFALIQRSRDVLFCFGSQVSRVAQLLLCLKLQRSLTVHSLFSKWAQTILLDQEEVKISSTGPLPSHSSTKWLLIRILIPLCDALVSFFPLFLCV